MPPKKDEGTKEKGCAPTFLDENKSAESVTEDVATLQEERIYWARAAGLSIANFVREEREGNYIAQPEASLNFSNHIKVTDDPEIIKFIESSQAFRDGRVKRVDTLEEAYKLTAQVTQLRKIREITSSVDEVSPTIGRK